MLNRALLLIAVTFLLPISGWSSHAQSTHPENSPIPPAVPLTAGLRIFVKGNNEVAVNLRRKLIPSECFLVVQNPKYADAILDVEQELEASGAQGSWTSYGSGTLTDKAGNLLWADSKQGIPGILHSGSGNAASELASSLFVSAGCKLNGKTK